ncbi:MAG: LysE family translocator [Opitutaceae bacterium]|nr:LysE family translocator [Opitutaceae bacterium]
MAVELAGLLGVLTLALLSPGPDFLLVVKNSVGGTRARALATAVGISAGLAAHMLLISLGLAATPASVLRIVQLVGVAFLGYLGVRAMLAAPAPEGGADPGRASSAHSGFVEGLVCNITNPKAFVFFVSLFAQVIRPDASAAWRVVVPVVVVLHGLVMWCGVVLALQSPVVARRLGRAQHWLPRVFGALLVLVAVTVLVDALTA